MRAVATALGKRSESPGRPRTMRPCPKCGALLSAREMRGHKCA